jgi:hypothetical protein
MQFITAASLFAAALAAPAPQTSDCPNPAHCGEPIDISRYENIDIAEYYLFKGPNGIESINFKLSGDDAKNITCSIGATTLPSETITCGEPDSNYRFVATKPKGDGDADLTIYHQTGVASGKWGEGSVPTYCHSAGGDRTVCTSVGVVDYVTIVIKS